MKKLVYTSLFTIITINILAYNHAYRFSHFNPQVKDKTNKPEKLSVLNKLEILFLGINNPKPKNNRLPSQTFEIIKIKTHNNHILDSWYIEVPNSQGTVLLFHGYTSQKSSLLKQSTIFNQLGYNTLLVDFYGSGDSDGNQTTLGYFEAEDILNVYKFISEKKPEKIIFYGFSMGAVAILRSISSFDIKPSHIIIEAPYGSLLSSVKNRFQLMGLPSVGLAQLLVLWGGIQHGYWGFSLDAMKYAKNIHIPTLIMQGANDDRVNLDEVKTIYHNLQGEKKLNLFPNVNHQSSIHKFPHKWKEEISLFIN